MHTKSSRLGALALGIVMVLTLAFGTAVAYAAWGSGSSTLTILASNSTDETFVQDVESAGVQVDVYQIATAAPDDQLGAYRYTLIAPFDTSAMQSPLSTSSWQDLALEAKSIVTAADGNVKAVATNHAITGEAASPLANLADGMYLVLAHGQGGANEPAYSRRYAYTYSPAVTVLPTREADENGVISTAGAGDWLDNATIVLKPERSPLYGSLTINKTVEDFSGQPATFVFHITGSMVLPATTEGGEVRTITYDNYAAITYNGTQESASTTVTHIPAGMTVQVEEVYAGARYRLSSNDTASKTVGPIVADQAGDPISVSFDNESNNTGKGGNGIENKFTFNLNNTGDWDWTSTPSQTAPAE